jgi:hypothetical protein
MDGKVIVAMGPEPADIAVADQVARQFGWRVGNARDKGEIAAVLLRREGLSWRDALRRVRRIYPEARVITCHGFDDPIEWGEFFDLDAFHSIRLPMVEAEVRQSLGFVWEAEKRLAAMRTDRVNYGAGHAGMGVSALAVGSGAGAGANS